MDAIIETRNLTKKFGRFTAVDKVNLRVNKGEIYGFLGLNGAGKTTTIRMLLGMIRPSSGESRLCGTRVHAGNHGLWAGVGYLVEIPYAYPDLTVVENLEMVRRMRSLAAGAVDAAIERLRLGEYRDRKARNLSLGNAQRLGLAKAIIHNPDILILDEPASGLDPAGIVEIRELLIGLAHDRGVTVFISSHILGEVARFATRIGIIHEGALVQEMAVDQLEHFRKRSLLVDAPDRAGAQAVLAREGLAATLTDHGPLEITAVEALRDPGRINALLVRAGFVPTMLKVDEEDLESYFLRVIATKGGVQ